MKGKILFIVLFLITEQLGLCQYAKSIKSSTFSFQNASSDLALYGKKIRIQEGVVILGLGASLYGAYAVITTPKMVSVYDNDLNLQVGDCRANDLNNFIDEWESNHSTGEYWVGHERYSKKYYRNYAISSIIPLAVGPLMMAAGVYSARKRINLEKTKRMLELSYMPGRITINF